MHTGVYMKLTHGNTRSMEKFFMGPKIVNDILGHDCKLSSKQIVQLTEFFDYFNDRDRSSIWRKNIAIWIKNGLNDWISRREQLSQVSSNSKEYFNLMYGSTAGMEMYEKYKCRVVKNLPNTVDYWIEKGYPENIARKNIIDIQNKRNKRATEKTRGTSNHTIRSKEFWISRGYSDEEAASKVACLQTRDEAFYIEKYGPDIGPMRFEQSKVRRKKTWQGKDKKEHALKTRPKTYNKFGQEIKAIQEFLKANNISEAYCKFGAPNEQFYQYIPGIGYRRYDLAVFKDLEHTRLKYILEYHGPGHINFSDFAEELRNEIITVAGKKLLHLGTYGAAYDNDMAKRNHILNNYNNVEYIVMWTKDLTNKRFNLNELLAKSK